MGSSSLTRPPAFGAWSLSHWIPREVPTIFFLSTPVEKGYKPSRQTVGLNWRPQLFVKWTSSYNMPIGFPTMSDPRKTNTKVSLYDLTLKWYTITSALVT